MIKSTLAVLILSCVITSCSNKSESIRTISGAFTTELKIDEFIQQQMDSSDLVGVSVSIVNENEVVYSGHFGRVKVDEDVKPDNQTLYELASLSKPVFATFVMKQVEKGVLNLDTPLYRYWESPDLIDEMWSEQITARMILCHSSGLPNWRQGDSLKIQFSPGTEYGYSGEGYEYLKNVLAHQLETDDKGLDSVFREEILKPLGIHQDMSFTWKLQYAGRKAYGHEGNNPTDNSFLNSKPYFKEQGPNLFASSYSLYSTSDSFAKFLAGISQKKILKEEFLHELLRMQNEMPLFPDTNMQRSLFSFIKKTPQGLRYFHTGDNGDFQSWMHIYPSNGFGIVILTNGDNLFSSGFAKSLLEFLNEDVGR